MNPKDYYTVAQYAEKLGVSRRRVRRLCQDNRVNAVNVGGMWWILKSSRDPRQPIGRPRQK